MRGIAAIAALLADMPWVLKALVGDTNRDVDNAEEAWAFFRSKRARH